MFSKISYCFFEHPKFDIKSTYILSPDLFTAVDFLNQRAISVVE